MQAELSCFSSSCPCATPATYIGFLAGPALFLVDRDALPMPEDCATAAAT